MTEKNSPSSAIGRLRSGTSAPAAGCDAERSALPDRRAAPPDQKRIPASAVRELCGGISDMTLWRWLNNPEMGFPPASYIAGRRYWRASEICAWLDSHAVVTRSDATLTREGV